MHGVADDIKSVLTARKVAELYGFTPNEAGFIVCPFHQDDTASVKIYEGSRGWHCFGCNAGGDVIDFVSMLFDLPFTKAVERIDQDFSLGLTKSTPSKREISEALRAMEKRRAEIKKKQDEYMWFTRYHRLLVRALKTRAPKRMGEPINDRYAAACRNYDHVEHWLHTHDWVRG